MNAFSSFGPFAIVAVLVALSASGAKLAPITGDAKLHVEKKDVKVPTVNRASGETIESPQYPSSWQNNYDGVLSYFATDSSGNFAPLCGLKSIHSNSNEDRRFKWAKCPLKNVPSGKSVTVKYLTRGGWTTLDGAYVHSCRESRFLVGIESYHINKNEDRAFKITCARWVDVRRGMCKWTGWLNNYDQAVDYSCEPNKAISGFRSVHHNGYEDRRWELLCCDVEYAR